MNLVEVLWLNIKLFYILSNFIFWVVSITPGQYYNVNITNVNIIGHGPILMINGELYNIVKK